MVVPPSSLPSVKCGDCCSLLWLRTARNCSSFLCCHTSPPVAAVECLHTPLPHRRSPHCQTPEPRLLSPPWSGAELGPAGGRHQAGIAITVQSMHVGRRQKISTSTYFVAFVFSHYQTKRKDQERTRSIYGHGTANGLPQPRMELADEHSPGL